MTTCFLRAVLASFALIGTPLALRASLGFLQPHPISWSGHDRWEGGGNPAHHTPSLLITTQRGGKILKKGASNLNELDSFLKKQANQEA